MAQQALDTPTAETAAPRAGRQEPMPPSPLPGWVSISQALIRVQGEQGHVDLAALDPARGIALVCFLDEGEEASPQEAQEALRAMLRELDMEKCFPGELPIVALAVPRTHAETLGTMIEQAFAELPRPSLASGWVDWVAERLAPHPAAPSGASRPRLVAPPREETLLEKPASGLVLVAPARDQAPQEKAEVEVLDLEIEAPAEVALARASLFDWGASLGFAFGILAVLLISLVLIAQKGRLF